MTIADPEGVQDLALLLGVAQDLAWVLGSHYVEKHVLSANLCVVLMGLVDILLEIASVSVVFGLFLDASVSILVVPIFIIADKFLVIFEKFIG